MFPKLKIQVLKKATQIQYMYLSFHLLCEIQREEQGFCHQLFLEFGRKSKEFGISHLKFRPSSRAPTPIPCLEAISFSLKRRPRSLLASLPSFPRTQLGVWE
jgi:hypothetical protein